MVAIPSIRGKEEPDAPFGRGPKQALEEVLKIATELGFPLKISMIKLDMPNMEKIVQMALIMEFWSCGCHASWGRMEFSATSLTLREGKLFGRGTLDNKGPILSNLYALYVLKENGVTFDRPCANRVRDE